MRGFPATPRFQYWIDWMSPSEAPPTWYFYALAPTMGYAVPPQLTKNITAIVQKLKERNIAVILAGISLPKNYSQTYIESFEKIFTDVAKNEDLPFMPFLLKDVAGVPLNLNDRIHPNKMAQSHCKKCA